LTRGPEARGNRAPGGRYRRPHPRRDGGSLVTGYLSRQLAGRTDPATDAGWEDAPSRKGFFTDTSICIGCKACEVACKEWNALPMDDLELSGNSYDNSGDLGASTWRHVAFVEQTQDRIAAARESGRQLVDLGMPAVG